jgi:hypothetical protein
MMELVNLTLAEVAHILTQSITMHQLLLKMGLVLSNLPLLAQATLTLMAWFQSLI